MACLSVVQCTFFAQDLSTVYSVFMNFFLLSAVGFKINHLESSITNYTMLQNTDCLCTKVNGSCHNYSDIKKN